jgi:plastocyanin
MRRPVIAISVALVAMFTAACAASTAPGWTYAPPTAPPSSQPAASGEASAGASSAPSGGASEAPSGGASEAPSGGASAAPSGGQAGGTAIDLSANGIAFDKTELSAPAGAAFVIKFNNQEAVPHNVEIKDANNQVLFKGDLVNGPAEKDYQVNALPAGTYTFYCIVHPGPMTGTLKVGG